MPDLFISYARADSRDFVARISAALEERGKDTWVDLDDIPAASVWSEDLRAGIAASDSFCFVISPASVTSENCRTELDHALALNKRLLPVLHLPAADTDVPEVVGSRNWIPQTGRFLDDFDGNLDTLVSAIETDLDWVREHTRWGLRGEEWVRRHEDRSLLARGSDLDQAEAFLSGGGGREPQPTELQGRYVLASRRAASRRQRQLVTGVSVALVVSLVLGVLALLQRNTAVEQRHEADKQRHEAEVQSAAATSRALAANAFLNLPTDPELSLLLGLEAAKASPTPEAATALSSALVRSQERGQVSHDGAVDEAMYSPDGTTILTLSEDLTAALWDAESGERIAVLEGHTAAPQKAGWSADGSRIVTIAQDSTAVVYDGHTGELLTTITDPDDYRLSDVLISADGSVVITSGFVNQQVHFWNAADGSLLGTIPRYTVDAMALSPDQSLLLTAEQGESVELWSTSDLSLLASYPEDTQQPFTAAAFSPDGSEFVTAGGQEAGGSANVRSLDGKLLAYVDSGTPINAAAFSPEGTLLATANEDGTAVVTGVADNKETARYAGHSGPVHAIAFSPSGDLVATGGEDGSVRLWRPDSGAEVADLTGHQAPVNSVVFNAAGDRVLSASDDSTARLWATTGAATDFPQLSAIDVPDYSAAAISENGRYALTAVIDEDTLTTTARTLEVDTGELVSEFVLDEKSSLVPVVSNDGELTMTTSSDGSVVRRTSDGTTVAEIPVGDVQDADFDRAQERVAVAAAGGRAVVADVGTGEVLTGLEGHDPAWEVVSAAFSPDGKRVATASLDGTVRVWDAETGDQQLELASFGPPPSHSGPGGTVVFSPDGHKLANALISQNDAKLWDADTGKPVATLEGGKGGGVVDLGFSDDGRFLVTASFSGGARLWDGRSGRSLALVTTADDPAFAVSFTSDSHRMALLNGRFGGGALELLDCDVCGDLDSLVDLAKTRVTRELTDTEKATYLSGE